MRSLTAVALLLFIILTIAAPPASAQPTPPNTVVYHVRQGDTLWSLARRFATAADRLAALNRMSVDAVLQIGRPLRVPAAPRSLRVPVLPAPVRPVATAPVPVVPSPTIPAVTGPAAPAPATPDLDPATIQELVAPDLGAQPPASDTGAPIAPTTRPAPAPNPPGAGPQRPRITPLPSRDAQWMTTIVALSKRYLGAPYRWGGIAPNGFDCSGFINYIFDQAGIDLPRTTFSMFVVGTPVSNDQLQAGDVVFFQTVGPGPSHAGIYLGNGRFIHTSSGQRRVAITSMAEPYYTARYLGARRY